MLVIADDVSGDEEELFGAEALDEGFASGGVEVEDADVPALGEEGFDYGEAHAGGCVVVFSDRRDWRGKWMAVPPPVMRPTLASDGMVLRRACVGRSAFDAAGGERWYPAALSGDLKVLLFERVLGSVQMRDVVGLTVLSLSFAAYLYKSIRRGVLMDIHATTIPREMHNPRMQLVAVRSDTPDRTTS